MPYISIKERLLTVCVVFSLAWIGESLYRLFAPAQSSPRPPEATTPSQFIPTVPKTRPHTEYSCDGRTYCSQMTSCDEAKYFLAHCPDVKMDGDGDGIPCERQWCTGG